jgi:hypothetical protein
MCIGVMKTAVIMLISQLLPPEDLFLKPHQVLEQVNQFRRIVVSVDPIAERQGQSILLPMHRQNCLWMLS